MIPELARHIEQLREWHHEVGTATPDQYAGLLGAGESLVGQLLQLVDQEAGAQ